MYVLMQMLYSTSMAFVLQASMMCRHNALDTAESSCHIVKECQVISSGKKL